MGVTSDGKPDRTVPIHFVGVRDTVSSFGWLWDSQTLPDTRRNESIRHLRHALSIDETRGSFRRITSSRLATRIGNRCGSPACTPTSAAAIATARPAWRESRCRWMLGEAKRQNLKTIDTEEQEMLTPMGALGEPDPLATMHNEANKLSWRLLSLLPRIKYEAKTKDGKTALTRHLSLWNQATARDIPEGSTIHISVQCRMNDQKLSYRPKLPNTFTWMGQQECEVRQV